MLKLGILSIAAATAILLIVSVANTVMDNVSRDPSANLANQVNRTQNKAQTLDTTFLDIMPPTPPGQQVSYQQEQDRQQSAPVRPNTANPPEAPLDPTKPTGPTNPVRPNPGANPTAPGQPGPNNQPTTGQPAAQPEDRLPEPTINPHAAYASPNDDFASQAAQRMDQIAQELEITPDQYAAAVNLFYQEWENRYQMAIHQHQRFAHRIHQADLASNEYFSIQRQLTESMPNQERREHYRIRDAQEKEQYREWQKHAYEILAQSNIIMDELQQMNLEITKQKLSANFAALYRDFEQVPLAISMLREELDLFRFRSQQLQLRFQNPT